MINIRNAARTAAMAALIGAASVALVGNLAATANAAPSAPTGHPAVAVAIPTTPASGNGKLYGDPVKAVKWWQAQTEGDCGVMAAADVAGQVTGRKISEEEAIKTAEKYGIYSEKDQGTSSEGEQKLIELLGAKAQLVYGATLEQAEQALAQGKAIQVDLDAFTIWGQPDKDKHVVDHAVVLTGIDTARQVVYLNDSGNASEGKDGGMVPNGYMEAIPLATFLKAWNPSNQPAGEGNAMIVTDGSTGA